MVTYGGNRPTVNDNEILTAEKFNDATRFWVTDELPDSGEDGDVVFVIGEIAGGSLPGVGGWATITEVSGTFTKHPYDDWIAYEWTADGSVTTTVGLVDALIIGGGATENNERGMPGSFIDGLVSFPGTPQNIKIGVNGGSHNFPGQKTIVGDTTVQGGGTYPSLNVDNTTFPGVNSDITGTGKWYACGTLSPNKEGRFGDSGNSTISAQKGVVIIRVPSANAPNVTENFYRWISYATVENGVVTKVTKTPDNKPYTASAQEVECDASVQEGYLYENEEFTAPEPDYSDEIAALTARLEELRNG